MEGKPEYERPVIIDYGSIADHTFGDSLAQNGIPGIPDRPSF